MKANELMIGDWVLYHNTGCIDAMNDTQPYDESIQIDKEAFECDDVFWNSIDPIPITPEILEKNGFKKDDDVWPRYGFVADIEKCPQTIITFSFYGKGVSAETLFRCWTKPKSCDGENNIHICDLKYVHELQHALRLCGIEKEIVL